MDGFSSRAGVYMQGKRGGERRATTVFCWPDEKILVLVKKRMVQ
jgi:hypothetical protein